MTEKEAVRLVKRLARDPRLIVEIRGRTCVRITNKVPVVRLARYPALLVAVI